MDDYFNRQSACELCFREAGQLWHLYTPGELTEIIFVSREDFSFGLTLTGVAKAMYPNLDIYAFELMSNHVHFILSGSEYDCREFFRSFSKKLKAFIVRHRRTVDFSGFNCSLLPLDNLTTVRNEICYVHRNGYLVSPDRTPFSYKWGTGMFYFCPFEGLIAEKPYRTLPYKDKRMILQSVAQALPDNYTVLDGCLNPSSYCRVSNGMRFFSSAHQYFYLLSKNQEANGEIAKRLSDKVFITDDEMYGTVREICVKDYGVAKPLNLPSDSKISVAKTMKFNYNASKKQIKRILKLDFNILDELFGPD